MAAQVDSLGRGAALEPFRPWSHDAVAAEITAGDPLPTAATMQTTMHQISEANIARRRTPPSLSRQQQQHHAPSARAPHRPVSSPPSLPSHGPTSRRPPQLASDDTAAAPPTASPQRLPAASAKDDSLDDAAVPRTVPATPSRLGEPHTPPYPRSCPRPCPAPLSLKRRRALSDVDGPNTAALCCKKRRLRRFLITSRLSQPFSQPATHILNRECVALGDKRFLKLAAVVNARRIKALSAPSAPSHSAVAPGEVLRRAAMANRLRRRIFADAAQGGGLALVRVGGPVVTAAAAGAPTTTSGTTAAEVASSAVFVQPGAAGWRPAFIKAPAPAGPHGPRPSSLQVVRALSRSPKLRPVRDQTQPVVPLLVEELSQRADGGGGGGSSGDCYPPEDDDDADGCAFPTSEHETRYEAGDDPDGDVYADFSLLFNSATAGDDDGDGASCWSDSGLDGLDDYMDELDGIAHLPR